VCALLENNKLFLKYIRNGISQKFKQIWIQQAKGIIQKKNNIKITAKVKIQHWDIKILKITCILVCNQNFEKRIPVQWNSKIPEPHLLLMESMKYVKKGSWCRMGCCHLCPSLLGRCYTFKYRGFKLGQRKLGKTGLVFKQKSYFDALLRAQLNCFLVLWLSP
jgi:hypothetical protein